VVARRRFSLPKAACANPFSITSFGPVSLRHQKRLCCGVIGAARQASRIGQEHVLQHPHRASRRAHKKGDTGGGVQEPPLGQEPAAMTFLRIWRCSSDSWRRDCWHQENALKIDNTKRHGLHPEDKNAARDPPGRNSGSPADPKLAFRASCGLVT